MSKLTLMAAFGLFAELLAIGCSSTVSARRPLSESALAEINEALEGQQTRVALKDQTVAGAAKEVRVARDVSRWLEAPNGEPPRARAVPTEALKQISYMRHGRGAGEGFGIGALAGLGVGALLLIPVFTETSGSADQGAVRALLSAAAVSGGIVLGALIGTITGAVIGHCETIAFGPSNPPDGRARCGRPPN